MPSQGCGLALPALLAAAPQAESACAAAGGPGPGAAAATLPPAAELAMRFAPIGSSKARGAAAEGALAGRGGAAAGGPQT